MAADAPDRHEDLVMMRIIGDAREGQPGHHGLVPEVTTNDFQARVKTMVLLRHVIQKGFPVCLHNMLCHGVSPDMSALVAPVMEPHRASHSSVAPAPQARIEGVEQVLCQCCNWTQAAFRQEVSRLTPHPAHADVTECSRIGHSVILGCGSSQKDVVSCLDVPRLCCGFSARHLAGCAGAGDGSA